MQSLRGQGVGRVEKQIPGCGAKNEDMIFAWEWRIRGRVIGGLWGTQRSLPALRGANASGDELPINVEEFQRIVTFLTAVNTM